MAQQCWQRECSIAGQGCFDSVRPNTQLPAHLEHLPEPLVRERAGHPADQAGRPGSLDLEGVFGWGSGDTASHWDGQVTLQQLDLAGWGLPLNLTGEIGHRIEMEIDGGSPEDLTGGFRYDLDSYQSGRVEQRLPALEAGEHRVRVRAFDNFNNPGYAEAEFRVLGGDELRLELYEKYRERVTGREIEVFVLTAA